MLGLSLKKVTPHDEWAAGVGSGFAPKMQRSRNIIYSDGLRGFDQVLVNFVPAIAYHLCLNLPAAFTQPWAVF